MFGRKRKGKKREEAFNVKAEEEEEGRKEEAFNDWEEDEEKEKE